MNSINYLDSILTRSLTTSRSGSGTSTPAPRSATELGQRYDPGLEARAPHGHGSLNRRASDYSLAREREREKRRVAASLGLTSLDAAAGEGGGLFEQQQQQRRSSSKRSSRKGSRAGSARHSESEQAQSTLPTTKEDERTLAAQMRRGRYSAGNETFDQQQQPKSYSEGYDRAELQRQRLKRTGSTPAPLRPVPSRGWSSLWGFGGFLEDQAGARGSLGAGGGSSYDGYMRRSLGGSSSSSRSKQNESLSETNASLSHGRRASTGDANAALIGFAPHALLSEREREDVVDLEGYDPDDDLNPTAPPSTPFPTASGSRDDGGRSSFPATPEGHGSSTVSKLSSLLFGALNPLTDDYFGPQAGNASRMGRRRASEASEKKRRAERARRSSHASKDSHSEASSSGHGHDTLRSAKATEKEVIKKGEDEASPASLIPSDPPPPYSDDDSRKALSSSASSSSSLLLPSPILLGQHASTEDTSALKMDEKKTSRFVRSVRRALEFVRRLLLAILLAPYRVVQYGRRAKNRQMVQIQAVRRTSRSTPGSEKSAFQTPSQAARPAAARHVAGRRMSLEAGVEGGREEKTRLMDGVKASDSDSEGEDEVVTEEQAEARAVRRARKEALRNVRDPLKNSAEDDQQDPQLAQPRASSRLLPNPNPVDPLLAHDRNSPKAAELLREREEKLQQRQKQLRERQAVVSRGPLSSLIHHSPKVLVLDLDETLIHSTSRSPTWSALADKSKSRYAVTTGGSLLGLEGLGGVLGLRGQVGVRPHQVEVVLDGRSIIYHVYKRPHVDTFLRKVAAWYHVVVFTASVQEYADPVIDWLDQGRGLISARLFRESCTYRNGSYYKNLSLIDGDLSRICLVDNSPASYMINQANGIPIEGWTHDPNDEALLDLLPVLDSLRFASDVRHILGIRGFSDPTCKPLPSA